jgi:hypothetical protein
VQFFSIKPKGVAAKTQQAADIGRVAAIVQKAVINS